MNEKMVTGGGSMAIICHVVTVATQIKIVKHMLVERGKKTDTTNKETETKIKGNRQ